MIILEEHLREVVELLRQRNTLLATDLYRLESKLITFAHNRAIIEDAERTETAIINDINRFITKIKGDQYQNGPIQSQLESASQTLTDILSGGDVA